MYIVLGATGHIGAETAKNLLTSGCKVTVVIRNSAKADAWRKQGASVAVVDIHDTEALAEVLKRGTRAFLLNPPANPSGNTDVEERKTVHSILSALQNANLEKIVLQSTYGAQPGEHCGDLGVLYEFEEGARKLDVPLCVIRGAYFMSNWLPFIQSTKESGLLPSLLPSDLSVPMVAPSDIGRLAAMLLMSSSEDVGIREIEGPRTYSAADVAKYLSSSLEKIITVKEISQSQWHKFYLENGFSVEAASSYARMTEIFVQQQYEQPNCPIKGSTDLRSFLQAAVADVI